MHCTGSLTLPTHNEESENALKGAEWGTMVHHWAQTGQVKCDSDPRNCKWFQKAIALSGIIREDYWPADGQHEGALSVRVDGFREASRDDTVRPGWVTGHYDYHWWMVDGELWVDDLKTGKYYPNPPEGYQGHMADVVEGGNRFPQDVGSPQLKLYALGLAMLLNYTGSVNVSVTHWPRLPLKMRHALPTRVWVRYTWSELLVFWGELEQMDIDKTVNALLLKELARRGPEDENLVSPAMILNPGDWCRFCPVIDCFVRPEF